MIEPKLSLEKFEQNIRIEKKLGQKLGYHLQNGCYSPQKNSQTSSKQKMLIREVINPLQVLQNARKPSKRLQQLNEQIEKMQMQKKINQISGSQQKQQTNVRQFLNKKIRQYNYLIDHKHITNRKKAKSQFQMIKKEKPEITNSIQVLQKIKIKQKDLNKTGSLLTKFKRNQQLSNLYRQYSKSMKLSQRIKLNFSTQELGNKNQAKIIPATTDVRIYTKIKPINQTTQSHNKRYQQDDINIEHPFIQKKSVQNFNLLNQGIKRNRMMRKIFWQKLKDMGHKNNDTQIKNLCQQKQEKLNVLEDLQLKNELSKFSLEYTRMQSKIGRSNQDLSHKQQQSYLSVALSKRSPKYIKSEGSKFLIKINTSSLAKSMLDGMPKKQSKKINLQIRKMYNRKLKIPQDLSNQQKRIMQMMIEDESDSYYWTTCRNQKINLMLKGRKHQ